ncbi:MAG: hypothetical protein JKY48_11470 [Flavobacteriales bacterium]|nr:hypothetical protein [Flavobacteriales bacterium]
MSNSTAPYISFVATSRNDNHGGDMTKRMKIFVKGLIHQCNKHQLRAELIMVEWNPPKGTALLHEILPAPTDSDFLSVRYLIVPSEEHKKLKFSDKLPIFQMIAKNVGIQRAKGEFVLCTNIDLLFSDELMEQLAQKKLNKEAYYRANRCDIPTNIDEKLSTEEQLVFSEKNILQRLGKNRQYPNFSSTNSFLFRFGLINPIFEILSKLKKKISKPEDELYNSLDMNACGDFTMMTKSNWDKIEGYPELEMYSLHIDSMGLFAAAAKGIKQIILPPRQCTYHISHTGGWEFQTPKEKILFYANKPVLDWWAVYLLGMEILKSKKGFDFNSEDWGLKNTELKEITIG